MNYLYDAKLNFGTAVNLAADSTSSVLDLGPDLNGVQKADLRINVASHDHTGAGTLTINLQDSADGVNSFTTVATTGALTFNTLAEGDVVNLPLPSTNKPYLRVVYDVSTALTGTVGASIAPYAQRPY